MPAHTDARTPIEAMDPRCATAACTAGRTTSCIHGGTAASSQDSRSAASDARHHSTWPAPENSSISSGTAASTVANATAEARWFPRCA